MALYSVHGFLLRICTGICDFWVSKMCDFSVRGRGAILCICGVGCFLFVAMFNRESELVSAIFGSLKCLPLWGWNVVQFLVLEALVARLRMNCTFGLRKRDSEPEFCLSGCSGKPLGAFFSIRRRTFAFLNRLETKQSICAM